MHAWMTGWGWIWMGFAIAWWLLVLGGVVYLSLRLRDRHPHGRV